MVFAAGDIEINAICPKPVARSPQPVARSQFLSLLIIIAHRIVTLSPCYFAKLYYDYD